jgi:SAM-dependent MidA family methyltransferase
LPVSLAEQLRQRIRREGDITFHDWMEAALYEPAEGYYQRSDRRRWGREGDYRTSPERSRLFAATFARYFAQLYEQLERPVTWTIVECGAGDGSFAAGVLETFATRFPAVLAATNYIVYEVSDDARQRAHERLVEFGERVQFQSDWDLIAIESGICFSNELLDAFPVHRVIQDAHRLAELYVTVDENDKFAWTNGPLSTPRLSDFVRTHSLTLVEGQTIEINLAVEDWLVQVARKLTNGFLITVDYGAEAAELYDPQLRPHGTLRAFSRHAFVDDVLAQPGEYDITASVNWTQVKSAGERLGLKPIDFASQDKFLLQAGLLDELEYQLSNAASEAQKATLTTGAREMILPGGMAASFQVLVQQRVEEEEA